MEQKAVLITQKKLDWQSKRHGLYQFLKHICASVEVEHKCNLPVLWHKISVLLCWVCTTKFEIRSNFCLREQFWSFYYFYGPPFLDCDLQYETFLWKLKKPSLDGGKTRAKSLNRLGLFCDLNHNFFSFRWISHHITSLFEVSFDPVVFKHC